MKPLTRYEQKEWKKKPVPIPELNEFELANFWKSVQKTETCWNWIKTMAHHYGVFKVGQGRYKAHRVSMRIAHGPLPELLVVDHICRNKACVNPAHLRLVTSAVNTLENSVSPSALNAAKTHCNRGHLLAGDNVWSEPTKRRGVPGRRCVECREMNNARNRARNTKIFQDAKLQVKQDAETIQQLREQLKSERQAGFDAATERMKLNHEDQAKIDTLEIAVKNNLPIQYSEVLHALAIIQSLTSEVPK